MIVECVPNFSEGRDPVIVERIANAVTRAGAVLLDKTTDPDHNRSVLTFVGSTKSILDAAFETVRAAVELIDITRHSGVHPRLGAADVVPFVPIEGITLNQCAEVAGQLANRLWSELRLPAYLYEAAAHRPECRRLENVRRLAPSGLKPDVGEGCHPTAGVCVVGARKFLIAWNVILLSSNLAAAKAIAREIRESSGGLPAVKALGLPLPSRDRVQVSMNLVDFEITPLHIAFDAVADSCRRLGIEIEGSELIGMIPAAALEASRGHDLCWLNFRPELIVENRLRDLDSKTNTSPLSAS
ncbi:MAG TPA: glutamate formimidoyltransferase [Bryobacteraceae bacterium]|nr:glutamate formimidoyltransferase [Bryobacteraceae bacterium]